MNKFFPWALVLALLCTSHSAFAVREQTVEQVEALIDRVERVDEKRLTDQEREWLAATLEELKEINSPMFDSWADVWKYNSMNLAPMIGSGIFWSIIIILSIYGMMLCLAGLFSLDEWLAGLKSWRENKQNGVTPAISAEDAKLLQGIGIKLGLTTLGFIQVVVAMVAIAS